MFNCQKVSFNRYIATIVLLNGVLVHDIEEDISQTSNKDVGKLLRKPNKVVGPPCNHQDCLQLKSKFRARNSQNEINYPSYLITKYQPKISAGDRIVNGEPATLAEHPWIVYISLTDINGIEGATRCGGSILDQNYIATAKHCITETGARGSIIYGTNDNTKTDNMVNFTIDDVIFNQFGYVDVVLIRTREAMKLVGKGQSGPQPIKLPRGVSEQPVEGDKVVVAGWGFSCGGDKNCDDQDLLPTTLQQVEILVVKPVCFYLWDTLLFGPNQVDTLLCASGPQMHGTFPQDSCAGDSGGPLECTDASGDKYLCGIVSMGPNPPQCGRSPGGYTMVNIDCVRLFLQSRGNQFAGEEMSSQTKRASGEICGKMPLRTVGKSETTPKLPAMTKTMINYFLMWTMVTK